MPLVAHLRQHLLLSRRLGQGVTLGNIVGQGLLREDGLAQVNGPNGRRRMVMVGRGDEDDVNVLLAFLEHLAVIVVGLGRRLVLDLVAELLELARELVVVHVTNRHEALAHGAVEAVAAHAVSGNNGDAELRVGRIRPQQRGHTDVLRSGGHAGEGGSALKKTTTTKLGVLFHKEF